MGKASAPPQADATTVRHAIGIAVARRAIPAVEATPEGVTVGATLVGTTTGLPPEGETAERTAVEGRTATAQIEVVTETSLIGRGSHGRTLLMSAGTAIQLAGRDGYGRRHLVAGVVVKPEIIAVIDRRLKTSGSPRCNRSA